MNLSNLDRQHRTILEEINLIENEIMKGSIDINPSIAGLHISRLAGQLRIHLMEEDEFLYPKLMNSTDDSIKNLADQYNSEMGNLAKEYTLFKSKLKKRIEKENSGLYRLIKERNI